MLSSLALLLTLGGAAMGIGLPPAEPPRAPTLGESLDAVRLRGCVAKIDANKPADAYEDAMSWAHEANVREARQCAGMALVAMGRYADGAKRLQELGEAIDGGDGAQRIEVLSQAGNAWMLAEQPKRALGAFSEALKLASRNPDLLIDRGRAYAMLGQWRSAEEDLSSALDARSDDALALTLRAQTRLKLGAFDLAAKDADAALRLSPKDVDALLVRGAIVDAKRTGKIPD